MNLYFQFLSQIQSPDVVRLLLMPTTFYPIRAKCDVRISAGGRLWTKSYEGIDSIVEHIQDSKFNQLEITYEVETGKNFKALGNLASIVGVFTPSASSDVWFKTQHWPTGGERTSRTRKMNARAAEMALSHYNVSRKPSVYEVAIEMDTLEPESKVIDVCAEWIAESIPRVLEALDVFGCMDVGGAEYFVELESNVLITEDIRVMAKVLPTAYPVLGERFEALHPLMFGSSKICNGIGSALGKDARVLPSHVLKDFAVLRVYEHPKPQTAYDALSVWLLNPPS